MGMDLRNLSGMQPGEHQSDTAATFAEARADFERTWQVFLSKRTEADFQAWFAKEADALEWIKEKSQGWLLENR
jgi:hypothetical protein